MLEPRVFVSHASADKRAIAILLERLIGHGLLLWVDRPNAEELGWSAGHPALDYVRGIDLSSSWREKIKEAINSSAALVVFWTHRSVKSTTVLMEVAAHLFRDSDFHINMEPDRPPPDIDGIIMAKQFAQARNEGELASMIARLIDVVRVNSGSDGPNLDREKVGAYWRLEQFRSARERGVKAHEPRSDAPAHWIPDGKGYYVSRYARDISVVELYSLLDAGQLDRWRLLRYRQCEHVFTPGGRGWDDQHPFGLDWRPGQVALGWDEETGKLFGFDGSARSVSGSTRGALWIDDLQ